ncbi:phospholipase D-like domain-containing protein [Jannaschia sp. LMIT008]|uniref:phospholipase D-like domain-containing protein n=1 Tax=Jannaschia maritima TaxID=3032585 RepID=UPI002811AD52|nr:phospholipase D-like domain-containing protein [Jannaschia sp. LMIT008]
MTTETKRYELEPLITAGEAYPALERLVLEARTEIVAGFRIFDLSTRLRTDQARTVGRDWFDLLLDALRRGVSIHMVISDFDAVVGTDLHGCTWRTVEQATAMQELAGRGAGRLTVVPSLHPARVGTLASLVLWPRVDRMLREKTSRVLSLDKPRRQRFLRRHPHLSRLLMTDQAIPGPRRWPVPPLAPVTHHQKVATIDGKVLYIGGLDLNERRWDDRNHDRPSEETWHDVQVIQRDPRAARAARTHLLELPAVIAAEAKPTDLGGAILRTISSKRHRGPLALSPKPVLRELADANFEGIRSARRLIYLETQFLRDRRIAAALAKAAKRHPALELILILPGRPEDVAFEASRRDDARYGEFLQALCIRRLRRAYKGRVFIGSMAQPLTAQGQGLNVLHGAPLIYVHSKVSIFDDRMAIVSSANLNGRSLAWDTELGTSTRDPATVAHLRERCMDGVLGPGIVTPDFWTPGAAASTWQRHALGNARTRPEERRGFMVPYLNRPAARFGRRLKSVPEEMV